MNFGDILDQWDKQDRPAGTGKKPAAAGTAAGTGQGPEKPDPLNRWLRENGVPDKDRDSQTAPESPAQRRRRLHAKAPDAVLDLHGLSRDEAWLALEDFFRAGIQRGLEKVRIIHGKGNHSNGEAVLSRTVREFIERCPSAGESGSGDAAAGGSGVTWVLLKGRSWERGRAGP
jgi:DNA-nicking Smr family endonuclease